MGYPGYIKLLTHLLMYLNLIKVLSTRCLLVLVTNTFLTFNVQFLSFAKLSSFSSIIASLQIVFVKWTYKIVTAVLFRNASRTMREMICKRLGGEGCPSEILNQTPKGYRSGCGPSFF